MKVILVYCLLAAIVMTLNVLEGHFSIASLSKCDLSYLWRPLSSDRQHLSYDVCLEIRGEIIRTLLFCIVY